MAINVYRFNSNEIICLSVVYLDDLLACSNDEKLLKNVKSFYMEIIVGNK